MCTLCVAVVVYTLFILLLSVAVVMCGAVVMCEAVVMITVVCCS